MIVLHHLEQSRSQRILWLLEELGLPYEIKHYSRNPKTLLAPPELHAVHALGKSPVITDNGLTVAESGAIIEYLTQRYGPSSATPLVPPADTPQRMQYTYWLHYAEGSLMPPLVMTLVFNRIESAPMPFFIRPIAKGIVKQVRSAFLNPTLESHIAFIEQHLNDNTWFAGEAFSAADIQMSFAVEALASRGNVGQRCPKISNWLKRIHAMPAYQRAMAKAGPSGPLG
jgi:glutathione S-transferase